MLKRLVHLLERLPISKVRGYFLLPRKGRCLRHQMLDGQILGVNRLFTPVGLLQPLEHELSLIRTAVEIERDGGQRCGHVAVAGVVLAARGQVVVEGGSGVVLVRDLGHAR